MWPLAEARCPLLSIDLGDHVVGDVGQWLVQLHGPGTSDAGVGVNDGHVAVFVCVELLQGIGVVAPVGVLHFGAVVGTDTAASLLEELRVDDGGLWFRGRRDVRLAELNQIGSTGRVGPMLRRDSSRFWRRRPAPAKGQSQLARR